MKTLIALAAALAVAGCASGPYYGEYSGYGYYDGYAPYSSAAPTYYAPAYGYPGTVGGNVYYYRDRDDDGRREWQDRRGDRARDGDGRRDRSEGRSGRDYPRPSRGPLDTRHGEAGNEAGM